MLPSQKENTYSMEPGMKNNLNSGVKYFRLTINETVRKSSKIKSMAKSTSLEFFVLKNRLRIPAIPKTAVIKKSIQPHCESSIVSEIGVIVPTINRYIAVCSMMRKIRFAL